MSQADFVSIGSRNSNLIEDLSYFFFQMEGKSLDDFYHMYETSREGTSDWCVIQHRVQCCSSLQTQSCGVQSVLLSHCYLISSCSCHQVHNTPWNVIIAWTYYTLNSGVHQCSIIKLSSFSGFKYLFAFLAYF